MNEKLTLKDETCKSSRKNGIHKKKKYWNDDLTKLWQNVRNNENVYLQSKDDKEKKIFKEVIQRKQERIR